MNDPYFSWLIGLIGDDYIRRNYQKLLWKLYSSQYIWELDYDRNRAQDGVYLRTVFRSESGYFVDENAPCSLLEMFIALARRAENDIMHDPDFGDRSSKWFWIMMQNLGLDVYDDYHYFENEVDRIIDIFVHRKYGNNGIGGAFRMQSPVQDLRRNDLWWQMNAYLEQNFPI